MDPDQISNDYRLTLRDSMGPVPTYPEFFLTTWVEGQMKGHTRIMDGWTNTRIGDSKILLRRVQCVRGEYEAMAMKLDVHGVIPVEEWRNMEGGKYLCIPTLG